MPPPSRGRAPSRPRAVRRRRWGSRTRGSPGPPARAARPARSRRRGPQPKTASPGGATCALTATGDAMPGLGCRKMPRRPPGRTGRRTSSWMSLVLIAPPPASGSARPAQRQDALVVLLAPCRGAAGGGAHLRRSARRSQPARASRRTIAVMFSMRMPPAKARRPRPRTRRGPRAGRSSRPTAHGAPSQRAPPAAAPSGGATRWNCARRTGESSSQTQTFPACFREHVHELEADRVAQGLRDPAMRSARSRSTSGYTTGSQHGSPAGALLWVDLEIDGHRCIFID